jgi:hypothetical protein
MFELPYGKYTGIILVAREGQETFFVLLIEPVNGSPALY